MVFKIAWKIERECKSEDKDANLYPKLQKTAVLLTVLWIFLTKSNKNV